MWFYAKEKAIVNVIRNGILWAITICAICSRKLPHLIGLNAWIKSQLEKESDQLHMKNVKSNWFAFECIKSDGFVFFFLFRLTMSIKNWTNFQIHLLIMTESDQWQSIEKLNWNSRGTKPMNDQKAVCRMRWEKKPIQQAVKLRDQRKCLLKHGAAGRNVFGTAFMQSKKKMKKANKKWNLNKATTVEEKHPINYHIKWN